MQTKEWSHAVIIISSFLAAIGLIAIYAASSLKGAQQFNDPFLFLRKQAIAVGLGLSLVFLIQKIPLRWISRSTLPLMGLTLFLLLLVFVPGAYSKVGGAKRWLNLPFIGGQPAELVKLTMILFLAKNLSRQSSDLRNFWNGIFPNIAVLIIFGLLLLVQKDFGTTAIISSLVIAMMFVAGLPIRWFFAASVAVVMAAVPAVMFEEYRLRRLVSFLDPWSNSRGDGFQIIQSFLAFRNGGLFGVGLGESKQKLFFLPESHTDFIFPVIGEELGLIGIFMLWLLYAFLVFAGFVITYRQKEPFLKFLCFGLTFTLGIQIFLNMGVTTGLLPTKGLPLPFISSGLSSLLITMIMVGLIAKIGMSDGNPEQSNV